MRIKQSYLTVHETKVLREILSLSLLLILLFDYRRNLGLIDGLLDLGCLGRHWLGERRHLVLSFR